jgi:hypothetical protein
VTKAASRSGGPLPWLEIALGGLLVAQVALPWTAWAAVALLLGFTAWLLTHRGVPCACFGAWSRRPAGWREVARNVVLIGLALVAIAQH